MFEMSACDRSGSADSAELQAASTPTTLAMTSIAFGFGIGANVPADAASAA